MAFWEWMNHTPNRDVDDLGNPDPSYVYHRRFNPQSPGSFSQDDPHNALFAVAIAIPKKRLPPYCPGNSPK